MGLYEDLFGIYFVSGDKSILRQSGTRRSKKVVPKKQAKPNLLHRDLLHQRAPIYFWRESFVQDRNVTKMRQNRAKKVTQIGLSRCLVV